MAIVMDLVDEEAGRGWSAWGEPALDEIRARDGLAGYGFDWEVAGDRCVFRAGGTKATLDLASLEDSFDDRGVLPDAAGAILCEFWIASFPDRAIFEPSPLEGVLLGAGGLVLGFPFLAGQNGSRIRVAVHDGRLVVDEAHPIVDPNLEGVFGAYPLSDGALELAHPSAWLATVASIDHETLAGILDGFVGVKISAAITDSLGPDAAIGVTPIETLERLPDVYVTATHTDREALAEALEVLLLGLVRARDDVGGLRRSEYRGAELWTLAFDDADLALPVLGDSVDGLRPTLALTDEFLILTTSPLAAKVEVRRLSGQAKVHAGLAAIDAPDDATSVTFVDWGAPLADAYAMALGGVTGPDGWTDADGEALSREDFPSRELFARYFTPGFRWTTVRDGVRVHRAETSIDTIDLLGAWAFVTTYGGPRMRDTRSRTERAKSDIVMIRTAISAEYAMTRSLPRDLDESVRESLWVRDSPHCVVDPWGTTYCYRRGGEHGYDVWSAGPDGVDDGGEGDDITVGG